VSAAWAYARELGLPVVVKPNSRSQGVAVCKVHNKTEFMRAARAVFRHDRVLLVQRYLPGHDYRIVVLDGEVISAYERLPLWVVGDGVSTVRELLAAKQEQFLVDGRDTIIDVEDMRLGMHLARRRLRMDSVLPAGERTTLLDNANLSTGGDAVDVTEQMHPGFAEFAINVTRDMGLRFCGVDIIVDGTIHELPQEGHYWVIEINAAPGLDHYAAVGARQEAIVDAMYLKVLQAIKAWIPPDASRSGSWQSGPAHRRDS
jgi:D-alanine-D-alanine ligase-like ATP-grasp enzyme